MLDINNMIPGFFLNIWFVSIDWLVGKLPISEFPAIITTSWFTIWGLMNSVNFLFPVYHLGVALGVYVLLIKTKFGVGIVKLIIGALRGVRL